MKLHDPLTEVKGIGPALAEKFARLSLRTVEDLIYNYPRTYNDFSVVTRVAQLKPGFVTIQATIKQATGRYVRRGMHITEAIASDTSGSVRLVWFNQPYRAASLQPGKQYFISGTFELSHQKFAIMSPACELVSDFPLNTARIVPVYRETKGLSSVQIRKSIGQLLPVIDTMPETLPTETVTKQQLLPRAQAIRTMHFPGNAKDVEAAKRRLGFEEVFELSLAALLNKQANGQENGLRIPFKKELAQQFVKELPFTLTPDQKRVVWQIYQDMESSHPMNRMIEGDVGSGKTVVATMAALMAMEQKFQVVLLVGGMKPAQKKQAHQKIADGSARMLIGTHALIQEKVDMHRLGLAIIDEQHRFGVDQRKKLQVKAGHAPHILTMTATPIPRSLALTLYGELDISIIHAKPKDRLPIITKIVSPNSRATLYKQLDEQVAQGRQVFVVCPLVTDSELTQASSAEAVYTDLSKHAYKHRRVGLLHGQLKPDIKNTVMQQFVDHKLDILVATTVVEVGVDVPNATVMLIENADRFGLAQLHQLRGRVGRSSHQGYCYLMMSDSKAPTRRLRALESTNDGFKLAEMDLELRGPGAIYGTMQHGALDLRVASLTDTKLIAQARDCARQAIREDLDLLKYKHLADRVTKLRAITNLN